MARVIAIGPPVNEAERRAIKALQEGLSDNYVVLHNFDVWKEAGFARALKKIFSVTVQDGAIEITFPQVSSYQAVLSAIAVRSE